MILWNLLNTTDVWSAFTASASAAMHAATEKLGLTAPNPPVMTAAMLSGTLRRRTLRPLSHTDDGDFHPCAL